MGGGGGMGWAVELIVAQEFKTHRKSVAVVSYVLILGQHKLQWSILACSKLSLLCAVRCMYGVLRKNGVPLRRRICGRSQGYRPAGQGMGNDEDADQFAITGLLASVVCIHSP